MIRPVEEDNGGMAAVVLVTLLQVRSSVWADSPDPVPEANDVTAGWIAAAVFAFLIVAVVLLGRSLVKQLRKAQAAEDAGLYGHDDPPAGETAHDEDAADSDEGSDADNNGEPHRTA